MLLAQSTWPEVEARLRVSRAVVVPIGSNEQHGPTGLMGTDWMCPEIIAHHASDAEPEGLLVAPTFAVGMAQHHLAFPGTISLRPTTLIAAVRDWTLSLAAHGFQHIYWLNGHGGNAATLEAAFSEIYAEASFAGRPRGFALKLRNWWELSGVLRLCARLFPDGHGSHATPSEIAVTQFGYPHAVKAAAYEPRVASSGPIREAGDFRRRHPDGRMGSDPAQASPEKGREIVELAARSLLDELKSFSAEPM
jgi:creatinine amidohydrolase